MHGGAARIWKATTVTSAFNLQGSHQSGRGRWFSDYDYDGSNAERGDTATGSIHPSCFLDGVQACAVVGPDKQVAVGGVLLSFVRCASLEAVPNDP